jgi:L-seryl-tRNA(Ser) seleniumtransferase
MDYFNPRALPAMHRLLALPEAAALLARHPRAAVAAALRAELDALRRDGGGYSAARVFAAAQAALEAAARPGLRRVINATGVVLHTNLGRAPLPQAAMAALLGGTCNLELDLETGRRGRRHAACAALLAELTGAEDAVVVNNGAAAMLLAMTALAAGGEAVVSRGELVEIGGGFRIPDVIRQGGARLAEVGTTNRTRLGDYAGAIGPDTRVLLRVHRSNFSITGFTAAPDPAAIAALAREHGLLSLVDLGSGAMVDLARHGLPAEPTLGQAVAQGFDLVVASGDKLLGGPQAGLVLGRAAVMARLAAHPLMRALRPDKLTLAALEATLRLYRDPDAAWRSVPVLAMLSAPVAAVRERAARLLALLPEGAGELAEGTSLVGGGSLPGIELPSCLVAMAGPAEALAARLRQGDPAVMARIAGGRLLLDLRTVADAEVPALAGAIRAA